MKIVFLYSDCPHGDNHWCHEYEGSQTFGHKKDRFVELHRHQTVVLPSDSHVYTIRGIDNGVLRVRRFYGSFDGTATEIFIPAKRAAELMGLDPSIPFEIILGGAITPLTAVRTVS